MNTILIIDDEWSLGETFAGRTARCISQVTKHNIQGEVLLGTPLRFAYPEVSRKVNDINMRGGKVVGFIIDVLQAHQPIEDVVNNGPHSLFLLKQIKADPTFSNLPTVMFTARNALQAMDLPVLNRIIADFKTAGALDVIFWDEVIDGACGVAREGVKILGFGNMVVA